MKTHDLTHGLPGLLAVLLLSACAPPPSQLSGTDAPASATTPLPSLPQYYGLYAVEQTALLPIGSSAEPDPDNWSSRADLSPETSFLIYSRSLTVDPEPLDSAITLDRLAQVRDERTEDGTVIPLANRWTAPNLPGYQVPLQFEPVAGQPEMIIAAPQIPLTPGVYSLKLNGVDVWDSRFGVAWSSVSAQQYAAEHCVEKLPSGYQPCIAVGGSRGFIVRELRSLRTTDENAPGLTIEGQLVNTSSVSEILPSLSASLLDDQNQVVQALPAVTLPEQALEPGGVYDFRINVTNPAPGAARVRVTPLA